MQTPDGINDDHRLRSKKVDTRRGREYNEVSRDHSLDQPERMNVMEIDICRLAAITLFVISLLTMGCVMAETEDLGDGYRHHGVATPVSNHRGIVATVDGDGTPVALVWLFDHTGGYALLMIDATRGEAQQFEMPFRTGDCPYSSILSTKNRFYTHFGSHFVEFDPEKPGFTFEHETAPQMAMSMTEDDQGRIWSATYPQSGVVCYDPASRDFRDYGHVYEQNWRQYPRAIAADDTGWVYFGIGKTNIQIIMLDPNTGEATPVIPEEERAHGSASVTRDMNGKVYGLANGQWYELYEGQATKIEEPDIDKKPIITSSQSLFHRSFPGGGTLDAVNLTTRKMVVTSAEGETKEFDFDYTSEGAHLMGLAAAADGTICGGTAFPMAFFQYNPQTDEWTRRDAYGQWNTVAPAERLFYVGGYGGGFLLEWDPFEEWVPTEPGNPDSNPRFIDRITPTVNRPHDLLAHPDGTHVILAGTPGYGYTGGGLLIWNRDDESSTVLKHTDLLLNQSTAALAPLPDGAVLAGTTIAAGTGGEVKAEKAELYVLDLQKAEMTWHEEAIEGVSSYTDMILAPNGLVFGIADRTTLFAFDPETREIVHQEDLGEAFGTCVAQQGTRAFVQDGEGTIYILFNKGIAKLDPETPEVTMLSESPIGISGGGDYLDGRIYFFHGSHMYSWEVAQAE